jgi:diguanylate cyclase (GGDEF)-like protein
MLDIDNFKQLNDAHGHNAGDEAIRHIGKVLREGTRGIDLSARIGGEEFAVLLVETELSRGLEVAERLRQAISNYVVPDGERLTASFGVAECPTSAQTAPELFKAADVLLYEAKRNGRNRVVGPEFMKSNSVAAGDVQTERNLTKVG